MKRSLLCLGIGALVCVSVLGTSANAGTYPPKVDQPNSVIFPHETPAPNSPASLIFSNTHNYGSVIIDVNIYNNYFGDTSKYWWNYVVRNQNPGFDPNPGTSNGFSGFELTLPVSVPDIADIDPLAPWAINCCSGLPVEWDRSSGPGVMPTQTQVFSFTTSPRLISLSSGWYHTWQGGGQTDIIYYPSDDAPEVPNVLEPIVPVEPSTWGAIKSLHRS